MGFNEKTAHALVIKMMDVIVRVETQAPDDFSDTIAAAILSGIRKQRDQHAGKMILILNVVERHMNSHVNMQLPIKNQTKIR